MGKVSSLILITLFFLSATADDDLIAFSNQVPTPFLSLSTKQLRSVQKLTGDKYIEDLQDIGFELSSQLFVTKDRVNSDNIYNQSAYINSANDEAKCKIYPTSMSFRGLSFLDENHTPQDIVLLPKKQVNTTSYAIKGFASFEHNMIESFTIIYDLTTNALPTIEKGELMRIKPEAGSRQENSKIAHRPFLLEMEDDLYVFNKYSGYVLTGGDSRDKFSRLGNFHGPADVSSEDRVVSVGKIDEKRFYVISNTKIDIYQISKDTLEKIYLYRTYDDLKMGSFIPIASFYDQETQTFFLTTFGFVYTVHIGDMNPDSPAIQILKTNGTCTYVDKLKNTIHLGCRYKSVSYIAQIYMKSKDDFRLNRFYSDMDIFEVEKTIKMVDGGMVMIGDGELRIQNYAINKQFVKDMKNKQPFFIFEFLKGKDLIQIPDMQKGRNFYFLGVYQDKIQIINLYQDAPQLYCQSSPQQKDDVQYNILMKFNATQCSFAQPDSSIVGSMMDMCSVSIPIKINTLHNMKIKVAGSNHGLTIAIVIVAVLIAGIAGVWSFKRWRGLDDKMSALTHQLQKLQKRGKKAPARI